MEKGRNKVKKKLADRMTDLPSWEVGFLLRNAAFCHGDWINRAAAARSRSHGNDATEATYSKAPMPPTCEIVDTANTTTHSLSLPHCSHPMDAGRSDELP